jgi:L-fucose isomerase-like protein
MNLKKTTFALFFGNRGFFPASLIATAREEVSRQLQAAGHEVLMLDAGATRHGAVETPAEGEVYARFLQEHHGKFGGVILCLPNFGDENGAVAALRQAGVPIWIQAYPDELERMGPQWRRDAFCGKFSIMDVFCQHNMKFTALKPHTVHPSTSQFAGNLEYFDRLCCVVNGMRHLRVGAIGARTSAFKTVRIDEVTLERHGITVETFDLAGVVDRVQKMKDDEPAVTAKKERLLGYCSWQGVPASALQTLCKLGVVQDQLIEENQLDAVAIRCWMEMQSQLGISPCVLLSEMNDRGVIAACEVDLGNAVCMSVLRLASGGPTTCLDWNNNYGDAENKCILFHCGPVPQSLMTAPGQVTDHAIIANALGAGCSYGCNTGRIAPTPMTFGSLLTQSGSVEVYLGQGRITEDPIPPDFFGCAGVAEIPNLQEVLLRVGNAGHRHHVSVTPDFVLAPVHEALEKYLGYKVTAFS